MHPPATNADIVTNDVAGINHVYNSRALAKTPKEAVDLRRIWPLGQVERCRHEWVLGEMRDRSFQN